MVIKKLLLKLYINFFGYSGTFYQGKIPPAKKGYYWFLDKVPSINTANIYREVPTSVTKTFMIAIKKRTACALVALDLIVKDCSIKGTNFVPLIRLYIYGQESPGWISLIKLVTFF